MSTENLSSVYLKVICKFKYLVIYDIVVNLRMTAWCESNNMNSKHP